jgi:4-amino-4-deoxy-L-arabinose transferase-like glycosyltransferase
MTARRRLSRFALGLIAITIVGFGVRVAFILTEAPDKVDDLGGDAYYYHHAANLLADGKGFIDPYRYNFGYVEDVVLESGEAKTIVLPVGFESPTAGHPPVYATYLAFFSELGLRSVRAHQLASAVLGCASIVLAGLLGRSLLGDRAGLIGAGVTAVYANLWLNDGIVMSETAAIAFAFLTTLLGLRFWRAPTLARGAWFAAAGGLAALSRAELVLFIPIVGAVALLRAPLPWRTRILRYVAMGAVAVAVVAPWVIRNNLVMNEPVLLSNGAGTVAVQANCDDTYYGRYIGYWSLRCGGTQPVGPNGEFLDESERDVVVRERAAEYISSHTQRLITVVVPARIGRMWGLYQPLDQVRADIAEDRPTFAAWLGFWQYVVLVPLAIGGAVVQWRRRGPLLVLGLWAVLATVTAATAFGNTRYRTAAEVSIVILATVGIDALVRALRREPAPPPDRPGAELGGGHPASPVTPDAPGQPLGAGAR